MKQIGIKIAIILSIIGIVFLMLPKNIKKEIVKEKQIEQKQTEEKKPDQVAVSMNGTIQYLEMDDYLLGVVAGEMPASFELEALKAQVVAARTFVYSRSLSVDNTTNSQVYLTMEQMQEKWKENYNQNVEKIKQAIQQTNQEVMKYNGQYISALFFSSSNGHTENSEDYFNGEVPYLKSVDCPWDKQLDPNYVRSKTFTKQQLQEIFQCKSTDFTIISYKESGRVDQISIDGVSYTGRQVREKLSLASSDFTIEKTNEGYVFTTTGSGHGVGMSQYGAQGMALEGKNYQEILKYFYTGIEIVNN